MLKDFLMSTLWLDSIKWLRIALVQVFLTWPLLNQTGWCSRTLSDSLLVVRPMYDVPQEHVNEYTQKLVVKQGILSLELWSAQTGWTEMNKQFCSFIGLFDCFGESSGDKLSDWVTLERKSDVCTFLLNSSWFSFIPHWKLFCIFWLRLTISNQS